MSKEKKLMDAVEDSVSNLVYYNRKEDQELTVDDIKNILDKEMAKKVVSKFQEALAEQLEISLEESDPTLHDLSGKMMMLQFYIEKLEKDPKSLAEVLPKMKKTYSAAQEILQEGKEKQK